MSAPRSIALLALVCSACGGDELATVVLSLESIPETVATLGVVVRDVESEEQVASATVSVPRTNFVLGVPAERLLEFTVIARINRLGSPKVGAMPAYVGRSVRTIALGSEQALVSITVHRAGVLTVVGTAEDDVDRVRGYRLDPVLGAVEPLIVFDEDRTRALAERTLILRTGRYDALPIEDEDGDLDLEPDAEIVNGRGLWVEPELESVARLLFTARREEEPLGRATRLAITLDEVIDMAPPTVRTPSTGVALADFTVRAFDRVGQLSTELLTDVRVDLEGSPPSVVVGPGSHVSTRIPFLLQDLGFAGLGRVVLRARARARDGRIVVGELALNVVPEGVLVGAPDSMRLRVESPADLERGTTLLIDLFDRRGLFAETRSSVIDFGESDPWAFFPGGPLLDLGFSDRGRLRRELTRPSGPLGLPVIVRATLTSTLSPRVLTASVTLPLLEIRPR